MGGGSRAPLGVWERSQGGPVGLIEREAETCNVGRNYLEYRGEECSGQKNMTTKFIFFQKNFIVFFLLPFSPLVPLPRNQQHFLRSRFQGLITYVKH